MARLSRHGQEADSDFPAAGARGGEYKLTLSNDSKVVFSNGKDLVESAVKVEQADTKYNATTARLGSDNGKTKVQEIRLGGTKVRLVFD